MFEWEDYDRGGLNDLGPNPFNTWEDEPTRTLDTIVITGRRDPWGDPFTRDWFMREYAETLDYQALLEGMGLIDEDDLHECGALIQQVQANNPGTPSTPQDKADAENLVKDATKLIAELDKAGLLPAHMKDALGKLSNITVTDAKSGFNEATRVFNFNISEVLTTMKNQALASNVGQINGVSIDGAAIVIAGMIVHDAWHAEQASNGWGMWELFPPYGGYATPLDRAEGEIVGAIDTDKEYDLYINALNFTYFALQHEKEAINIQSDFLSLFSGLVPQSIVDHYINDIISLTDQAIIERYISPTSDNKEDSVRCPDHGTA
jgi:hypothetical protein